MSVFDPARTIDLQQQQKQRVTNRYGTEADFSPPFWNDTIDVLLNHRTTRAYLPRPLPQGSLELLVAAAQSAPTSSNLQAWSVVAVEDNDRKARLADFTGGNAHIKQAPLFLVWLVDLKRLRNVATSQGNDGEGLDYLESFLIGVIDAALAAQNSVSVIDSLGLGSCYVGGIRNKPEDVSRELNLPADVVAVFGLSVGYPDPAVKTDVKPRLPQSSVLFRETYSGTEQHDLDSYDEVMKVFQERQGLPEYGWTAPIAKRIENAEALKGRADLKQTLHRLGFSIK
ncbi:NADPH-dependent oxidoreductase [Rhizobium sp. RM]|uniref:NADPH-dependent oxidoreductase n=1 Tax=Rhizobium sp. RM TaxID=2748079 RepID=UPI00110E8815|nr:NADPH-dependent oxidoreductase [Rhizobium sp. RM]NWJ25462.1 NADPH-dependent oxidoreductase [Rhizobium sp. RM]TMV22092.1 NADPH-dependent oxidoreductase [Rhizobium sp. Td3]